MRLRVLTALLLLTTGALSVKAFYPEVPKITPQLAVVNIDPTPLDRQDSNRVTSYADVLDEVRPAVVSVFSTRVVRQRQQMSPFGDDPFFRRFFGVPEGREREQRRQGLGSGVIVSSNGYILTNNHVIEGADEIRIAMSDQREFEAKLVGSDPQTDIAILKIEAEGLPTAALTDSDQIRVGDIAFALGNPLGIGQTVTMGIVSATGRMDIGILGRDSYENFIQTDAAINQGNSGGPLVDANGRVIGINTAILSRSGGNIGIGFAIPANIVANVMESLIETGTVERGYMGVHLQPLSPELAEEFQVPDARGALIGDVVPGSAADRAGLRPGDVVVRLGDRPVRNHTGLRLQVGQMRPGVSTEVEIIRDGERQTLQIVLDRRGDAPTASVTEPERGRGSQLLEGITVAPVSDEHRGQFELPEGIVGLVVTEVDGDSRYAREFPPGSVIVEINRQTVSTLEEARAALQKGGNLFRVYHRGSSRFLLLRVD